MKNWCCASPERTRALVTIEENAVAGGAGSAVLELLANCAQCSCPRSRSAFPIASSNTARARTASPQAELDLPGLESRGPALVGPAVGRENEGFGDINRASGADSASAHAIPLRSPSRG